MIDQPAARSIVPVEQEIETVACGLHFGLALFPLVRGLSRADRCSQGGGVMLAGFPPVIRNAGGASSFDAVLQPLLDGFPHLASLTLEAWR